MRKIILLTVATIFFNGVTKAQLSVFNGRVTNGITGLPVAGATIKAIISGHAAQTNQAGLFSLRIQATDSLLVTHIGFRELVFPTAGQDGIINIRLMPFEEQLEEVVINTGYQKLKPNEVNGSFVVIDNKKLNLQQGTNILDRLNGVTSGLMVNMGKQNNNPQNNTGIIIRGHSTINGPLDPLIVVDNFIYEGDIANLDPNDVESVTILKDAAAASIWGARAGNGVIVITTKKARFNQKTSIEVSTGITVIEKPDLYYRGAVTVSDYIDFEQFLFQKGFFNSQLTNRSRPALSPAVMIWDQRRRGLISPTDSAAQINSLRATDSRAQFAKYFY